MKLFIFILWAGFWGWPLFARAGESPEKTPGPPPIGTHWTTLSGMQYLRDDQVLSGPELETAVDSLKDPESSALLRKSEEDETWGFIEIGASVGLSIAVLFVPNTQIYAAGLKISTPYLPLAVPGTVLGIVGALLEDEAGTAKYAAVQRYNRLTQNPPPVTWNFSYEQKAPGIDVRYRF